MILRRLSKHVKEQNWFAVGLDFLIVVIGVLLAIQISNWNDARIERALSQQYMASFREDLLADQQMLQTEIEARQVQHDNALTVLGFYEGRALEPNTFFEAYYAALFARNTRSNRNTMDELLNSGSLRLIRDTAMRSRLLDLYAHYDRIADTEAHMARDFDTYLYDPTFSTVPIQLSGPWEDTPETRLLAETLLSNVTIENGFRLIVANLDYEGAGLQAELQSAYQQVESLLDDLPAD